MTACRGRGRPRTGPRCQPPGASWLAPSRGSAPAGPPASAAPRRTGPRAARSGPERAGQPQPGLRVGLQAPGQRRAQVVVLGLQPRQPAAAGRRPSSAGSASLGQRQAPVARAGRAPPPPRPPRASRSPGVLRAPSPAAGSAPPPSPLVRLHQRLVDQPRQQVEHVRRLEPVAGADRLGRLQRPAAGEDRQPAEQRPAPARSSRSWLQSSVARSVCWRGRRRPARRRSAAGSGRPAGRRSARPTAPCTRAAASSSASGMPSSRRQISRHRRRVRRRSARSRAAPARARSTNRRDRRRSRAQRRRRVGGRSGVRQRQRGHAPGRLAGDAQRARGWWPGCAGRGRRAAARSASAAQASSRCSQLSSTSSRRSRRPARRPASRRAAGPAAPRTPSARGDRLRARAPGRPAPPARPARRRRGSRPAQLGADLQRQAGLADAAGAGQRQQPRRRQQAPRPRPARARARRSWSAPPAGCVVRPAARVRDGRRVAAGVGRGRDLGRPRIAARRGAGWPGSGSASSSRAQRLAQLLGTGAAPRRAGRSAA